MPERPYFSSSFDELLAETKRGWSNAAVLRAIAAELEHRTTIKAGKLKRDVHHRLAELPQAASDGRKADPANRDDLLRAALTRADKAEAEVVTLREALSRAQSTSSTNKDPIDLLFHKYGLNRLCEDEILDAVQRVYRKRYHPDTFTDRRPEEQRYATRMFQEIEVDFSKLRNSRS